MKRLSLFLLSVLFSSPVFAYLDPGTGSLIIQMTIAGILSVGFVIKTYWYRLVSFFNRILGREPEAVSSDSPESPEE